MRDACVSLGTFPGSMVHEALQPIPGDSGRGRARRHYQLERLPDLNAVRQTLLNEPLINNNLISRDRKPLSLL